MKSYQEYLKEKQAGGVVEYTITYQGSIFEDANKFKPLEEWGTDTVNEYCLFIQKKNKRSTVETKKTVLKTYFTWAGKKDIIEHLKIKHTPTTLKCDDILTPDDINLMIETTDSLMYKALIAFLFESGGRVHEILPPDGDKDGGVKFEDVKETDRGMIIRIHATKTGDEYRTIPCIFSAAYIRNLIAYQGLKEGDLLFNVKRSAVHQMLNIIAKKAGITKPMSPHKFRHAQAVDMLKRGYQDMITKKKLGWKDDSAMLARYSHVIDDDVINASLEKAGIDAPKIPIVNIQQPIEQMKPIDQAMQMQKLNAENEELRNKQVQMEALIGAIASKLNLEMPADLSKVSGIRKVWTKV